VKQDRQCMCKTLGRLHETIFVVGGKIVLRIYVLFPRAWVRACACVRVCVWVAGRGRVLSHV
jgi:hypothetical protein